jgi:hypothetical protein
MLHNSIACFQELHLSFLRLDDSVLLWSATASAYPLSRTALNNLVRYFILIIDNSLRV